MTCNDCIHYEVCKVHGMKVDDTNFRKEFCGCFKDKSRFVELPCNVGDTVYFITDRNKGYKKFEIIETTVTKVGRKGSGAFFQMRINSTYETAVSALGKNVFATREEAEKKLQEISK